VFETNKKQTVLTLDLSLPLLSCGGVKSNTFAYYMH